MEETSLVADAKELGQRAFAGAVAGFVSGLLVGGIGGRLAMFLLRVTSGAAVVGRQSDDDFTMGSFTPSTMFLVMAAAVMGVVGGLCYSLARGWLPERFRPLISAVLFALIGGVAVIKPGGVDFTLVKPAALSIFLFILLPGIYGYCVAKLAERWLARKIGKIAPWLGLLAALLPIMIMGTGASGLGGLLVLAVIALWFVGRRISALRKLPSHPAVTWLGRGALTIGAAAAGVFLMKDILEIL
ncbi:MAG: hypothetical protein ACR2FO_06860 [Actinomycetota bacterium]